MTSVVGRDERTTPQKRLAIRIRGAAPRASRATIRGRMTDDGTGARAKELVEGLAKTMAAGATAMTYTPAEVRVSGRVEAPLPTAIIGGASRPAMSASDSAQETALFVEQMARAQETLPPASVAEAYEVVAPIARGGMGEVWRAVQRSLGREVALKQLAVDDPGAATHFLSEARVTARLSHANIVPVHALGRAPDGRPMLAMKLVKGHSWLDLLREDGAERDLGKHLAIFLAVCNAVAFAHAEGFLHRDLKPANVMVGDYGQVFVVDWGIAVGLDLRACEESGILHVRDVRSPAGTPAYMAPELALGDGAAQGPATDVYLLGACLFEVVTGAPPHADGDVRAALSRAIESARPVFGPEVPRELAKICQRAMARAPERRYPDVAALRAAVEAYLAHDAARAITEKGNRALERLRAEIAAHAGADERAKAEIGRSLHRAHSEARFAFETALESWPEAEDARRGLADATRAMLEHALATEDVALATRLSAEIEDEGMRARVEELRARVAGREAELHALREHVALLDDSRVARPLGRVFVVAGILGGAAIVPTRYYLNRGMESAALPITAIWTGITVLAGAYAFLVLRGVKKSLVSPRVGWTWAAVGVACLMSGAIAQAQGEAPFDNAAYTTSMIAIGFVAMAMQTRLWLLFPAAATFAAALAMGFFPARRVEIFGALWVVTLGGAGVFLLRTKDARDEVRAAEGRSR